MHTTMYCCTAVACDGSQFTLQDLVPGKLAIVDPHPPTVQKAKRNVYRPTQERPFLEFRLIEWLQREHSADPWRTVRPPDLILSETQRMSLVRVDPKTLKTAKDITTLFGESDDWDTEWSAKLFEVIQKFEVDYAHVTRQSTAHQRKKQL